ncbi:MAG: hypothetical protein E6R03_10835 [Hyphomicrobiaceae bacterium]|nr:MAG: hypothetical protein E6R03_10835 [Hyphomicrobiaceae bacterium]
MTSNQIKTLQAAVVQFLNEKKNVRGVYWTAKNIVGNGFSVLATGFEGCAGTVEEGDYFPTEKEVSNAIRSMIGYVSPDRTESGRGAFGRLGGSSKRSKYHAGYLSV